MSVDVQISAPPIPFRSVQDSALELWGLGQQLLNDPTNIEYLAANLEAGIIRAQRLKEQESSVDLGGPFDGPSVFNLAAWHTRGIQTDKEIVEARWNPGHASLIVDWMPTALKVLGLQGLYHPGVQYYTWK